MNDFALRQFLMTWQFWILELQFALVIVTTIVEDPLYLTLPYITSTNLKKIANASGWNPTPCQAK